jgi:hypothetical protein
LGAEVCGEFIFDFRARIEAQGPIIMTAANHCFSTTLIHLILDPMDDFGWFGLGSMSCKSCSSLVWVLRSVENSAGQWTAIMSFEPELSQGPTIMTAKPLLLNHPNLLETPHG